MLKNRDVVTTIILCIVTCGIYAFYWVYVTAQAIEQESDKHDIPAILVLILSIFVGSVGFALFGYSANAGLNAIRAKRGEQEQDNLVAYIILGFFLPIVVIGMVQSEINKLVPKQGV